MFKDKNVTSKISIILYDGCRDEYYKSSVADI